MTRARTDEACGLYFVLFSCVLACSGGSGAPADATPADATPADATPADATVSPIPAEGTPIILAADDGHLYWITGGGMDELGNPISGHLVRRAANGGSDQVLSESVNHGTALAIDATHVFWSEKGSDQTSSSVTDSLWSVVKDGSSAPTLLASGSGLPGPSIALNSSHVFWTIQSKGVMSVQKDGSNITSIHLEDDFGYHVSADEQHVYWATERSLQRAVLEPAGTATLLLEPLYADRLVVSGSNIVWAENSDGTQVRIRRADLDGSNPINLGLGPNANLGLGYSKGLTVDSGGVTYSVDSEFGSSTTILEAPMSPGASRTMAVSDSQILTFVSNLDHVFWIGKGAAVSGFLDYIDQAER